MISVIKFPVKENSVLNVKLKKGIEIMLKRSNFLKHLAVKKKFP